MPRVKGTYLEVIFVQPIKICINWVESGLGFEFDDIKIIFTLIQIYLF